MAPKKVASVREWIFLGQTLQDERKAKGWRAEDLASRVMGEPGCAGTNSGRIRKIEGGFAPPNVSELLAFEKLFRVSVRKWYEVATVELETEPSPEPSSTPARPKFTPVPQDAATLDKIKAAQKKIEDAEKARGKEA